jgi:hypothetical protein
MFRSAVLLPVSPQLCVLVPEVRPMQHSKDTHISQIQQLLATPQPLTLQSPSLPHEHMHALMSAYTVHDLFLQVAQQRLHMAINLV